MRNYLLILFVATTIFSCGSDEPSDVLPKEKMQKVLWDVAQGGEFLNSYIYFKHPEINRAAVNNAMLDRILKINNITRTEFDNSLVYYKKNPKKFTVILDSITAKQQRLQHDTIPAPRQALPNNNPPLTGPKPI